MADRHFERDALRLEQRKPADLGTSWERTVVTNQGSKWRWGGTTSAPSQLLYLPRNPPEHGFGGEGGPSLWTWILQRQKMGQKENAVSHSRATMGPREPRAGRQDEMTISLVPKCTVVCPGYLLGI